jgi:hypothetical protein
VSGVVPDEFLDEEVDAVVAAEACGVLREDLDCLGDAFREGSVATFDETVGCT